MTDKEWLRNILKKQEEDDFFVCTDFVFEDVLEDKNAKSNIS